MVLGRDSRYTRLSANEVSEEVSESGNDFESIADKSIVDENSEEAPLDPPEYRGSIEMEFNSLEQVREGTVPQEMQIEEPEDDVNLVQKFTRRFQERVVLPVNERVVLPIQYLLALTSDKTDFYLNKVGNPVILRRFIYIFLMSIIMITVTFSGSLPIESSLGITGMFSDHDVLMGYAKESIDLAKFERDLEYLSSMPHMSGTKGDQAVKNYILESFQNNGLKLVKEDLFGVYSTYPNAAFLVATPQNEEKERVKFEMTKDNFNPMSTKGLIKQANLIYGGKGSLETLQSLKTLGLFHESFVLLLDYNDVVSEQVLAAQKYGAKGIIFISEPYGTDETVIQKRSVALPQFYSGDALTPGWQGPVLNHIRVEDSKAIPKIPTLPISQKDAKVLKELLSKNGLKLDNDEYSGVVGDLKIDLGVDVVAKNTHLVSDVIGKIEGREQTDKAIVITASRTSVDTGAIYPNFGTAMLLSMLQLFQELKYKYHWKPLRNIYFISLGGEEFNYAGATELVEQKLASLKDEVYTVVDISQVGTLSDARKLIIEAHPLLETFYKRDDVKEGFEVNVSHVKQYGNWTPFMAVGIPVAVISSPDIYNRVLPIETKADTFEDVQNMLHDENRVGNIADLLYLLTNSCLKLSDEPLIPFDIANAVRVWNDQMSHLEGLYNKKLRFDKVIKGFLLWKTIGNEWANWVKGWENVVFTHDQGYEPSLLSVHRWTWNKKLTNIGRRQCVPAGLPSRKFYKNVLLGPAMVTESNGEKWTYPGVRDAIQTENWDLSQAQLDLIGDVLHDSAALFIEETNDVGY